MDNQQTEKSVIDQISIQSDDREIQEFLSNNPDIGEAIDNMLHNALAARGYNPEWVTWDANFILNFREENFSN